MALITNYSTLETAVQNYLGRDDQASFAPNFIQNAQMAIYRDIRCLGSETALSGTISSGVLTLPTNFIGLKFAYVDRTPIVPLEWVQPWQIYQRYPDRSTSEIPKLISRDETNLIFGPSPGDYDIAGVVYTFPTLLSGSNETNWFTTHAVDLLLYGALLDAADFLGDDPRIPGWRVKFQIAKASVQSLDNHEGSASGPPVSRTYV